LKEFEALAREALGSDEGFAPVDETLTNEASIGAPPSAENAASAEMEAREELLEETAANNEGMPENEDSAKAATTGQ